MGRKRVIEAPALKSWEDVNEALRQIAEAQIAIGDIESEMQKQVLGAQKVAEQESKPSTSVSLPRAKEKLEEIIRRLKSRQMTDCIVVEEKVSKEALKKYGEDTVNAVGATWKQGDVFGYELNIARLEQIKAGVTD